MKLRQSAAYLPLLVLLSCSASLSLAAQPQPAPQDAAPAKPPRLKRVFPHLNTPPAFNGVQGKKATFTAGLFGGNGTEPLGNRKITFYIRWSSRPGPWDVVAEAFTDETGNVKTTVDIPATLLTDSATRTGRFAMRVQFGGDTAPTDNTLYLSRYVSRTLNVVKGDGGGDNQEAPPSDPAPQPQPQVPPPGASNSSSGDDAPASIAKGAETPAPDGNTETPPSEPSTPPVATINESNAQEITATVIKARLGEMAGADEAESLPAELGISKLAAPLCKDGVIMSPSRFWLSAAIVDRKSATAQPELLGVKLPYNETTTTIKIKFLLTDAFTQSTWSWSKDGQTKQQTVPGFSMAIPASLQKLLNPQASLQGLLQKGVNNNQPTMVPRLLNFNTILGRGEGKLLGSTLDEGIKEATRNIKDVPLALRVLDVDEQKVFLCGCSNSKIKVGDKLAAERFLRSIKDTNGRVIRTIYSKVGTLEITAIDDALIEAKIVNTVDGQEFKRDDFVKETSL